MATAELAPMWGVALIPLAAGCAPDEAAGFPGAPEGAVGEPIVTTVELTPL